MLAAAVPGYGYRYRRHVLDSLKYIDVRDLATGGEHIPELREVYVDLTLVSRAPQPDPGTGGTAPGGTAPAAGAPDKARNSLGQLLGRRSRGGLALVGPPR